MLAYSSVPRMLGAITTTNSRYLSYTFFTCDGTTTCTWKIPVVEISLIIQLASEQQKKYTIEKHFQQFFFSVSRSNTTFYRLRLISLILINWVFANFPRYNLILIILINRKIWSEFFEKTKFFVFNMSFFALNLFVFLGEWTTNLVHLTNSIRR